MVNFFLAWFGSTARRHYRANILGPQQNSYSSLTHLGESLAVWLAPGAESPRNLFTRRPFLGCNFNPSVGGFFFACVCCRADAPLFFLRRPHWIRSGSSAFHASTSTQKIHPASQTRTATYNNGTSPRHDAHRGSTTVDTCHSLDDSNNISPDFAILRPECQTRKSIRFWPIRCRLVRGAFVMPTCCCLQPQRRDRRASCQ